MSKHSWGLTVGLFLALLHFVWSCAVAFVPGNVQMFMDWVFKLHHISMPFAIVQPFVVMNAVLLLLVTFVAGYIVGWILKALHNLMHK